MYHSKKAGADRPERPPERVETYSGYRLHERPRRFTWQGEWLEVTRIVARWQEPAELAFLVLANNSRRFLLKYQQDQDSWEIQVQPGSEPQPD
jgi:hypothetical protein